MSGIESDTIGGYNSMMEKQKKEPREAYVTTVLFDDGYELLQDRINLRGVDAITNKEYFVRGSTALLDAIRKTINKIGNAQKQTAERERAEKVIFVITTDGMENSSREYMNEIIKKMVEKQKKSMAGNSYFLEQTSMPLQWQGNLELTKIELLGLTLTQRAQHLTTM